MPENNFKDKTWIKTEIGKDELLEKGHAKGTRQDAVQKGKKVSSLHKKIPNGAHWHKPKNVNTLKKDAKMNYEAGSAPSGTNTFAPKFVKRKDGSTGISC